MSASSYSSILLLTPPHHHNSMRNILFAPLSLLRTLTLPLSFNHRFHPPNHHHFLLRAFLPQHNKHLCTRNTLRCFSASSHSSFVEQLAHDTDTLDSDGGFTVNDDNSNVKKRLVSPSPSPAVEVKELEDMPEQWRRARIAWLCKELPNHKAGTLVRILNQHKKWMRQEDATYVVLHCLRIRDNLAAFRVYKWMIQQHWYRFDFALVTKLADYLGKERTVAKCREVYDDILNQGRVPSESTFHILVVAYLSAPVQGSLEEACSIYNRMIQLGGYRPTVSLHNTLFRALVSKPGGSSKHYLKQAEFIYHNLSTCGLEVHKDIYGGLIWLHSYQDTVDIERIVWLRKEMKRQGFEESRDVLVSILRASSKVADLNLAEQIWLQLSQSDCSPPTQAFVYKMETYANIGEHMKSFDVFRDMKIRLGSASTAAYHKIIEVLCKAQEINLAQEVMQEFINSSMKPLIPSYADLMNMYLNNGLHEKLELTFLECVETCQINRSIYNMYLDSLVKSSNLSKAEEIFNQMLSTVTVGVNTKSCNLILSAYLNSGEFVKAEKIYDLMCQKKYDIDSPLMEKLDYILSLSRTVVKKPLSLKLSKEQREILVGLLLGGLKIDSDEARKNHVVLFELQEDSDVHLILKNHLFDLYHEWLHPSCKPGDDEIPFRFYTVSHSYFGFYAEQFWPKGGPTIPKLIHRWISPRVLAYWYMYGGHRISSGDILLKVKGGNVDGVEKIVKTLKAKSLDCRVKKKGKTFWIGFLGSNATWFWKLVEPYILDDLKDSLEAGGDNLEKINFDRLLPLINQSMLRLMMSSLTPREISGFVYVPENDGRGPNRCDISKVEEFLATRWLLGVARQAERVGLLIVEAMPQSNGFAVKAAWELFQQNTIILSKDVNPFGLDIEMQLDSCNDMK
ncbi:hypothetical protein ACFE04_015435 [Oxalis oulophora]